MDVCVMRIVCRRVPRVRSHLPPTVPGQQTVNDRMCHRSAKALGQGRTQRPNDQRAAICGLLGPRFQEFALLLHRHRSPTATAPLRIQLCGVRQSVANLRLVPNNAGAARVQSGSLMLQSRVQQCGQQDCLGTAQILDRLRSSRQALGVLDQLLGYKLRS